MAKVTLTFEDQPGDRVKIVSDPSFETLMKMAQSGHQWTSAQGYAIFAINQLTRESKSKEPTKLWVPRVGRA